MIGFFTVRVMAYICAGLGIAVLGLSVALWAAGVRIDDVKNQRDAAELRVKDALKTIDGQKTVLAECDTATKKLEAEGKERQKAADKAVADAKKEAGRYQQEAKRLRGLQAVPTPQGADCRAALREIRTKTK